MDDIRCFPSIPEKGECCQCNRSCLVQVLMASTKQEPPAECSVVNISMTEATKLPGKDQITPEYHAGQRPLIQTCQGH